MWGWGRWKVMKDYLDLPQSENDIEHISRTLLLHTLRSFRGDDRTRDFIWKLIIPSICENPDLTFPQNLTSDWAALPEYNPPAFAVDSSFQRHVQRNASKLLYRIHSLFILKKVVTDSDGNLILKTDMLEDEVAKSDEKLQTMEESANDSEEKQSNEKRDNEKQEECKANEKEETAESATKTPEALTEYWDDVCNEHLLIGIYIHGLDLINMIIFICFLRIRQLGNASL